MNTSMTGNGKPGGAYDNGAGNAAPLAPLATAAAKLRGNRIHATLKVLCFNWMKKNRPELVAQFKAKAERRERSRKEQL